MLLNPYQNALFHNSQEENTDFFQKKGNKLAINFSAVNYYVICKQI